MKFCKQYSWPCILVLIFFIYNAWSAFYPKWDYTCSGANYDGIYAPPVDLGENAKRYIMPPHIAGCQFKPRNDLRSIIDWFFPFG